MRLAQWRPTLMQMGILLFVPGTVVAAPESAEWNNTETTHFVILWQADDTSSEEVAEAKRLAERYFDEVSNIVGPQRTPDRRLFLVLAGDGEIEDGDGDPSNNRRQFPRVARDGVIYMFRFESGYFEALSHELVHAFRMATGDWNDSSVFIEEGFASFVGDRLQPDKAGFPYWGIPQAVVSGHWIEAGLAIPLPTLVSMGRDESMKCRQQSYPLRASFFDFLDRRFGRERLLDLAYERDDQQSVSERLQSLYPLSLSELENAWHEDVMAAYRAVANADALANEFRTEKEAKYFAVCR